MDELLIEAERREIIGKQVKSLRREGLLPAIMYGTGSDPIPVSLNYRTASRMLAQVTGSSLIKIRLDGEEYPSLVREKQRDVLRGSLIHVDFQVVSLTEVVRANVAIQLEGESPAVTGKEAVLVSGLEELEVECLPADLPSRILVDVSVLLEVGDTLYVKDLAVPPKVEVLNEPDEMVVLVSWIGAEEEEEVEEEVIEDLDEPEVIERGRREEEEEEE